MKQLMLKRIGTLFFIISVTMLLISVFLKTLNPFMHYKYFILSMLLFMGCLFIGYKLYMFYNVDIKISDKISKSYFIVALIYYVVFLILIRFQPETYYSTRSLSYNINLIPLKQIFEYILAFFNGRINKSIILNNLIGGMVIYIPIGILVFNLHLKKHLAIFMFYFIIITIGIIQLFTRCGIFDIDDIILSSIGFFLGYITAAHIKQLFDFNKIGNSNRQRNENS